MVKIYILILDYQKILNWEAQISNVDSLQNSYENYFNNNRSKINNLAAHKKPLKSYILRNASRLL